MNLWNFLQSLGGHWAVQLFDQVWVLEHNTCDWSVFPHGAFLHYCKKWNKSLSTFFCLLKKHSLCITKFHSTNQPCNHICSGMVAESFTAITRLLQGHLLIFVLHEEPQIYWFICHLQVSILVLKPFFIG